MAHEMAPFCRQRKGLHKINYISGITPWVWTKDHDHSHDHGPATYTGWLCATGPVYSLQMAQRYDGGGRAMRRQVEAGSSNPGWHIEQVRVD